MMMAATMLTATSCSEFDDYNKAVADATPSGNQTLWQNIEQNTQLSDFAALVKKAGFDADLSANNYYTVWAPLNNTFDPAPFQTMSKSALMQRFVKNHIASYGHQASGKIEERVLMLNEKSYNFTGSSSYEFDGVTLNQANQPNSNGLLHTLNGVATFYPSIYEFITDSTLSDNKGLDSLRNFVLRYETTYLDTKHSVVGPIVNGMQTYVDSVMITENALWDNLSFKMNNEDSTYTLLAPTNEAWAKAQNKIKSNFNYIATTSAQAFNGVNILPKNLTSTIDNAYWQDSLTSRYLTRNLAYSNRSPYNRQLLNEKPTFSATDSLYSTMRNKFSNPQDIINQTKETVKMSNGFTRLMDSLAFYPWETYSPEKVISVTRSENRARITSGNAQTISIPFSRLDGTKIDLDEQDGNALNYAFIESSSAYSKAELDVYLPNVLSTTYDFYCVFVPENVDTAKSTTATLPNRVVFELNYCGADGKLANKMFLNEDPDNIANFLKSFPTIKDNATNKNTVRGFSNDTSKVDTVYIGEFTFPVCYYGLGEGICPNLKITTPFAASNKVLTAAFTRDFRIAAIILKPKELVEFEEKNK